MHTYRSLRSLALLVSAVVLAACDKNGRQDITGPVNGALVKFQNFGVGTPGVNFYAGTEKVTAIGSANCAPPNDTTAVCQSTGNEATTGTAYSQFGNGALYNEIAAGQTTLTGQIATVTDKNLVIATAAATLANGKFYSYFVSGIYDGTAKKADAFVVEDPIPTISDYTQAYVRFVNAISNSQPMTLYAKSTLTGTEVAAGSTVAYEAAGAFTSLPAGVYDLNTRTSGSSTNLITRTAASFVAGHVYTVTARGDMVSTVTANKPALDNTANR
jgi:hypothetical protein